MGQTDHPVRRDVRRPAAVIRRRLHAGELVPRVRATTTVSRAGRPACLPGPHVRDEPPRKSPGRRTPSAPTSRTSRRRRRARSATPGGSAPSSTCLRALRRDAAADFDASLPRERSGSTPPDCRTRPGGARLAPLRFDVTSAARPGTKNVLAVEVFPPQPDDLTITFVDWNPQPPDRNMGLWRDVYLTSRAVSMASLTSSPG